MPLLLRPALPQDLDILLQLEQQLIETERAMDPTIQQGTIHYYDLPAMIADPNIELIVAELDGKIVGSGYARIEKSRHYLNHPVHAYLGFMYVVPAQRGTGINEKIISTLRQWALSRGIAELRLDVYHINTAAIRAYEKAGFTRHQLQMRQGLS